MNKKADTLKIKDLLRLYPVWVTKSKQAIPVHKLEDSHIINILNLFVVQGFVPENFEKMTQVKDVIDECFLRGLENKVNSNVRVNLTLFKLKYDNYKQKSLK